MTDTDKNTATKKIDGEVSGKSGVELDLDSKLRSLMQQILPSFGHQWNQHNLVTLKRQSLSRIIYYHELYQKILNIPGVICEFGVHWGSTLTTLINLRGMYEPYNASRTIFGFDTFEGFVSVDAKDGAAVSVGDYATEVGYEEILSQILQVHESFSPLSHIKKFDLIKGDASETVLQWLEANPHAIIAMAIFDMDVYKPTRDVLTAIIPRLTKGSVIVFDELNHRTFPGETVAVQEVLGLHNISLRRMPHQGYCSWCVYGE